MMGDVLERVAPSRYAQFDEIDSRSEQNRTRANEAHHILQDDDRK